MKYIDKKKRILVRALAVAALISAFVCLGGVGLNEASRTVTEGYAQMFGGGIACLVFMLAANWVRGGEIDE